MRDVDTPLKIADGLIALERGHDELLLANNIELRPLYIKEGRRYILDFLKAAAELGTCRKIITVYPHEANLVDVLLDYGILIPLGDDRQKKQLEKTSARPKSGKRMTISLYLLMSQSCNMRCIYCLDGKQTYQTDKNLRMSKEIAFRSIERCLDEIDEHGRLEIIFFGGEPLLNWPLAKAQAGTERLSKFHPYTVQLADARCEFCFENIDGSKLTQKNLQNGRVANIMTGTRVATGPNGHVRMVLPDDTVFTIGPNSNMVIDEFVYDAGPATPHKILVTFSKRLFRWVTGKVARKDSASMRVTLPVGDLGIRGMDFEIEVAPDKSGYIKLYSGALDVTEKRTTAIFLNAARAEGYLKISPMLDVEKPKIEREKKGRALKPDEIQSILEQCPESLRLMFLTALLTGMRGGELFGLWWEDFDWETNMIRVRRAVYWRDGKNHQKAPGEAPWVYVTPKSEKSRREIDLSPALRKELLELCVKGPKTGLVFRTVNGTPLRPNNITRRSFRQALRDADAARAKAKLPAIGPLRWHDLRHAFGSIKIEQGENIYYVQRQMGHSSIQVTIDIYGHQIESRRPEAAARTDEFVLGR